MNDFRHWITVCEAEFRAPRILYHGSKPALLPTIKQQGLTAASDTSWQEFGQGVYLARTIEAARQYGELVFAVDLAQLDQRNLVPDDHELRDHFQSNEEDRDEDEDEDGPTGIHEASWLDSLRIVGQCQYLGDIPPSALRVVPKRAKKSRGPPRFNYRVDFEFEDGTRDHRIFPSPDEESVRRQATTYFDARDGHGEARIVTIKNVGRLD